MMFALSQRAIVALEVYAPPLIRVARSGDSQMRQLLSGITVIELADGIAGSYCGKLFADFGAEVIKVEPTAGDSTRRYGPFPGGIPDPEASGLFLHLNTNKRGVTLDYSNTSGRLLLLKLLETADLVIESAQFGEFERHGLGWDDVHRVSPRLSVMSVTPFGLSGPYATYKSDEIIAFAMGGALNNTGTAEREPIKLAGNVNTYYVGSVAATAALAAVLTAQRTGVGQHVEVSAFESLAASADRRATLLTAFQYNGRVSHRSTPGAATRPLGSFPCADGYVAIQTNVQHVRRMAEALDSDRLRKLFEDPEWETDTSAREVILTELYDWLLPRTRAEIEKSAQEHGWAVVGIKSAGEVVEADALWQRGFWLPVVDKRAGPLALLGPPFRPAEGGAVTRRLAPSLGEHNREIYGSLGVTPSSIRRLRAAGVI